MSSSTKMRRKKRQLISEDFLLETAIVNRENQKSKMLLLQTTSYSSCAVHLNSVCPSTVLYTCLFNDPFEINPSHTWYEEMCKQSLFWCLPRWAVTGNQEGRLQTTVSHQPADFSNSEAHLQKNPSRAVSCSNSSDKHVLGMRFSSVWFLIGTDCT